MERARKRLSSSKLYRYRYRLLSRTPTKSHQLASVSLSQRLHTCWEVLLILHIMLMSRFYAKLLEMQNILSLTIFNCGFKTVLQTIIKLLLSLQINGLQQSLVVYSTSQYRYIIWVVKTLKLRP